MRFRWVGLPFIFASVAAADSGADVRPQIAAFYFGNYHVDARNERVHGKGWSEWEVVKAARPRFPGHQQPKIPLWGYTDEADPAQMAQKIAVAADHGIDAFIFDWYYYNDGPYLQRPLDEGYLHASNRDRMKFALMWANHNWKDIHPVKLHEDPRILYRGSVTRGTFEKVVAHIVKDYFLMPSYWKIDGAPYFSFFDFPELIRGLGGMDQTIDALNYFRAATKAAGFPDLHLNFIDWPGSFPGASGEEKVTPALLHRFGFQSATSYVWITHIKREPFPVMPYLEAMRQYVEYEESAKSDEIPLFPNVTMGWDSSPRTVQSDKYEEGNYPFITTFGDNTPANYRIALSEVKRHLTRKERVPKIITLNAWNEWTEGSYLEPDTLHGLAYLEAVKAVFGLAPNSSR